MLLKKRFSSLSSTPFWKVFGLQKSKQEVKNVVPLCQNEGNLQSVSIRLTTAPVSIMYSHI